eukprot:2990116-Rhodomonas_salina.2
MRLFAFDLGSGVPGAFLGSPGRFLNSRGRHCTRFPSLRSSLPRVCYTAPERVTGKVNQSRHVRFERRGGNSHLLALAASLATRGFDLRVRVACFRQQLAR